MTRFERIAHCREMENEMSQLVQMANVLADTFREIAEDLENELMQEVAMRNDPRQQSLPLRPCV